MQANTVLGVRADKDMDMGPDDGASELSLKPSSLSTTRQRVRSGAVPPHLLPMLLALTTGPTHAAAVSEGNQSYGRALSLNSTSHAFELARVTCSAGSTNGNAPKPWPEPEPGPEPAAMPEARKREAGSGLELNQEQEPRDKAVAKAGSATGATEAVDRCPTLGSYHQCLYALLSRLALLSSVRLGPFLLPGLVSSAVLFSAVTTRSRSRGYAAGNSKMLKTGIGPKRRWLILGWLAFTSGFRLPEDNGVAQVGADVESAHNSPLSSHESTVTGEVDGAHDRRQLASSSCDGSWYVSPRTSPPPPSPLPSTSLRNPSAAFLLAATTLVIGAAISLIGTATAATAVTRIVTRTSPWTVRALYPL